MSEFHNLTTYLTKMLYGIPETQYKSPKDQKINIFTHTDNTVRAMDLRM